MQHFCACHQGGSEGIAPLFLNFDIMYSAFAFYANFKYADFEYCSMKLLIKSHFMLKI